MTLLSQLHLLYPHVLCHYATNACVLRTILGMGWRWVCVDGVEEKERIEDTTWFFSQALNILLYFFFKSVVRNVTNPAVQSHVVKSSFDAADVFAASTCSGLALHPSSTFPSTCTYLTSSPLSSPLSPPLFYFLQSQPWHEDQKSTLSGLSPQSTGCLTSSPDVS